MAKISVIVPVYGIEDYIGKCIESIINQTYSNLEIILVDDGSKDRSGDICDEYAAKDNRIIVIHKPNGGLTSARNAGLEKATGDWIMHVDGDDWIETNAVELLVNKGKEKGADIVMSDFSFEYPDKIFIHNFYSWEKQGYEGLSEYIATPWTCLCGSLQKKSLYDKNDLRSPTNINYCEDFHLIVRLCFYSNKVAKVNKPLYHYWQRSTSIIHMDNKAERDEMWAYSDIIDFFKKQGVYNELKKAMAWRSLKGSQELALDTKTFEEFRNYNPDKKDYIFDCPFINTKLKIIAWCLTHRMNGIAATILRARNILGR